MNNKFGLFISYFTGINLAFLLLWLGLAYFSGSYVLFSNDGPIGIMLSEEAEMSSRNNPHWFVIILFLTISYMLTCLLMEDETSND